MSGRNEQLTLFGGDAASGKRQGGKRQGGKVMYSASISAVVYTVREASGPAISHQDDIAALFDDVRKAAREMFFVVTLDQKNRIIDRHLISMGSLTASLVHPREVFRPAILDAAAAVAFIHNHPSGDTTPSAEDRKLTKRLVECANLLGIRVLDHVIVGDDNFGFHDNGLLS